MGIGGLVLALLAAAWLSRPVELPRASPPLAGAEALGARAPSPAPAPEAVPAAAAEPLAPPTGVSALAPSQSAPVVPGAAPRPWPVSPRAHRTLPEQHLRVVRALRAGYATPLARRDAVLAELHASGESQEPWTRGARVALDTWRTTIEANVLPVQAEPPRCYAAGCVARVTFPDAASHEEARQRVPGLKLGDVGRHLQLPPEHLPSGEVVVSWAVLSPARP
ncbi:MAG TPA: hypothetical protein VFZ09_25770 [Archangium sp.]|uniref:hypothetical protein n=1 Tax=Archangium sp. TaxID=1872627 RepID=UPI002E2FE40C|nr:hypothetical protein [Archangium sp.]HEX5749665.1 hypothetical protein [Archangium sp.]